MGSITGLKQGKFTSIDNSGEIRLGNTLNSGTAGQALVSGGPNEPVRWDTHTGTIQPLTIGTNLSLASGNPTFDGGTPDTLNATDTNTQLNLTEGNGITITNTGGLNRTIALNADGTTLSDNVGSGQAGVLKVPNALTAGTNISFSSGTTYDGSSAITINASDTDTTYQGSSTINIDTTTNPDTINCLKVPNALTAGTNISFSSGTTFDGSSAITINASDTDTTYQGGTGISIDTTTNPDTINCNSIPNSALQNSTISGKALGTTLANITFFQADGTFITSYNGADPPTSVTLDGDTTYQGGTNITIDTTTNPDTINLNASLTSVDLSSATNTFPLFVGGSEILKSMSYIDNSAQNFNRIFNTANKYFFDGSQTSGTDTLEIDFTATSSTGYCEYGFYANTLTSGMIFCVGIAAATGGTSPFSTSLGSGAVSIDAYKIGLFDGTTSTYSLKEILDFTSFENTYITSKFFFNNLSVGTRYRMALYGRCFNSGSIIINAGGKNTTGLASRSFHQPAFMKFYEYDSSIGGARTTGSGGGDDY